MGAGAAAAEEHASPKAAAQQRPGNHAEHRVDDQEPDQSARSGCIDERGELGAGTNAMLTDSRLR